MTTPNNINFTLKYASGKKKILEKKLADINTKISALNIMDNDEENLIKTNIEQLETEIVDYITYKNSLTNIENDIKNFKSSVLKDSNNNLIYSNLQLLNYKNELIATEKYKNFLKDFLNLIPNKAIEYLLKYANMIYSEWRYDEPHILKIKIPDNSYDRNDISELQFDRNLNYIINNNDSINKYYFNSFDLADDLEAILDDYLIKNYGNDLGWYTHTDFENKNYKSDLKFQKYMFVASDANPININYFSVKHKLSNKIFTNTVWPNYVPYFITKKPTESAIPEEYKRIFDLNNNCIHSCDFYNTSVITDDYNPNSNIDNLNILFYISYSFYEYIKNYYSTNNKQIYEEMFDITGYTYNNNGNKLKVDADLPDSSYNFEKLVIHNMHPNRIPELSLYNTANNILKSIENRKEEIFSYFMNLDTESFITNVKLSNSTTLKNLNTNLTETKNKLLTEYNSNKDKCDNYNLLISQLKENNDNKNLYTTLTTERDTLTNNINNLEAYLNKNLNNIDILKNKAVELKNFLLSKSLEVESKINLKFAFKYTLEGVSNGGFFDDYIADPKKYITETPSNLYQYNDIIFKYLNLDYYEKKDVLDNILQYITFNEFRIDDFEYVKKVILYTKDNKDNVNDVDLILKKYPWPQEQIDNWFNNNDYKNYLHDYFDNIVNPIFRNKPIVDFENKL
jgi:hypothetical protein